MEQNENVTHADLLQRITVVETVQQVQLAATKEAAGDIREIKAKLSRMVGFWAGITSAVSVIWIAGLAIWHWIVGK